MSDDFKFRLKQAYRDNPRWARILDLLQKTQPNQNQAVTSENISQRPAQHDNSVGAQPKQEQQAANPASTPTQQESSPQPDSPPEGLNFSLRNGLIYFADKLEGKERLCIPKKMHQEVFELAHDQHYHSGFHRTYERIVRSLYLRKLSRRLLRYITHCPQCQVNQTKRHAPYGSLRPLRLFPLVE